MRYLGLGTLMIILHVFIYPGMAGATKTLLKVGDPAPDFELKDDTGTLRSLKEFRGKKVVVYFYPKDDTPGCTKEACNFRDNYDLYEENHIVVIGINYDSPESHRKFKEKYNLPFILLTDADKQVAKAYGAYGGVMKFFVPRRMTFLIDEQGKIVHIFEKVDVTNHARDVLKAFGIQIESDSR